MAGVKPTEDLVDRDFNATAPNLLWSSDFTYIPTAEGWLYLAGALDCFSRRLVGRSTGEHMRAELVVDALQMAVISASNACVRATPLPSTCDSNPTAVASRTLGRSITVGPLVVATVEGSANPLR